VQQTAVAISRRVVVTIGLLALGAPLAVAQPSRRDRVRYDLERVTVFFPGDRMPEAQMTQFARLVDQGVRDVESYLTRDAAGVRLETTRLTFFVSDRVPISRAWGRRVALPLRRVETGSAPYLHEVAHALVPGRSRETWLSEGFASYVECWVAENVGGYAANVFSSAGNAGIDRDALRHLRTRDGLNALSYIGREGTPDGFEEDRQRVAPPFYVLSQSFFKYLAEHAGLPETVSLLDVEHAAPALERATGRPLDSWKADWLAHLGGPAGATVGDVGLSARR